MSEIGDVIQDSLEPPDKSRLNSLVALFVAITASFMALCNVKDGNVVQAMDQAQARALDEWSYYQAKNTKLAIAQSSYDLIKTLNPPNTAELLHKYEEEIAHYEQEKLEIKAKAEGFEKEYDDINLFDDQFDMTDALLTIAVAMFGITSLTQKKWLLWFASAVSVTGIILGIAAFLKISLHSDFISKILG